MAERVGLHGLLALSLSSLPACGGDDSGEDDGMAMDSGGADSGETSGGTAEGTADGTAEGSGSEGGSDETGEDMGPWASLDERPCPEDNALTYENFGAMFMLNNCTSCHHSRLPADMRQMAPIEVNFDDIEDIRAQADRIWIRSGDENSTMPPVGAPDLEQRTLFGEWLACGAPTNADLGM